MAFWCHGSRTATRTNGPLNERGRSGRREPRFSAMPPLGLQSGSPHRHASAVEVASDPGRAIVTSPEHGRLGPACDLAHLDQRSALGLCRCPGFQAALLALVILEQHQPIASSIRVTSQAWAPLALAQSPQTASLASSDQPTRSSNSRDIIGHEPALRRGPFGSGSRASILNASTSRARTSPGDQVDA